MPTTHPGKLLTLQVQIPLPAGCDSGPKHSILTRKSKVHALWAPPRAQSHIPLACVAIADSITGRWDLVSGRQVGRTVKKLPGHTDLK